MLQFVIISKLLQTFLPESTSFKRHKPNRPKPHTPHKSHRKRQKTSKELEQDKKLFELYKKLQSATKVAEELNKEGIQLSIPTILKRVRGQILNNK